MIDFRYHVVSLIAVFLALALGILVGTTQLNGAVLDNLRGEVTGLTDDRRGLQQDVRTLQQQVKDSDSVTASLAPRAVAGQLRNTTVVLLAAPDATGQVKSGVQKILEDAGATITGRIQLTDGYTDPRRAEDTRSFVTGSGQPAGFQLPESDDAGVLAGALLSYVLLRGSGTGAEPAAVNQVLSGFASLQMLRVETPQVTPAEEIVVVSSGQVKSDSSDERIRSLTNLVLGLDKAGKGTVVAGTEASAAAATGLVGAVRADSALASAVSTVDNANGAAGQIATVFALNQQAAGHAGQYGVESNAQSPFPPTPTS